MSSHSRGNCGDSTEDWGVFDVLCVHQHNNSDCTKCIEDCDCSIDAVTALRSELGALSLKNQQLQHKFSEIKGKLAAKEVDYDNLMSQTVRQTTLIASLQNRLENTEKREKSMQSRYERTIQSIKNEKLLGEGEIRKLVDKTQQLESNIANLKTEKEQIVHKFTSFLKCLGNVLCQNDFTNDQSNPECILMHVNELVAELQRTKTKTESACHTLSCCEHELSTLKKISHLEKQHLTDALESAHIDNKNLQSRNKQIERELKLHHDRLNESELCMEKLKTELRGLESRCFRIQNNLDRTQSDRLEFMELLARELNITEPCETLIKNKISEILNENKHKTMQLTTLGKELSCEKDKFKDLHEKSERLLRTEENLRSELEERLQKYQDEITELTSERLFEFLQRLAHVLKWEECLASKDINCVSSFLLERVQNIVGFSERHGLSVDTNNVQCYAPAYRRLRRERTCNDMILQDIHHKESSNIFNLQKRIRVLRDQIQKRDLQLELLKRRISVVEDITKENFMLQNERDEAVCRLKKSHKQIDKLNALYADAKSQIVSVKAQLAEAIEHKLTALEQARKIDELSCENRQLALEKSDMLTQIDKLKGHLKSLDSCCSERQPCHDKQLIKSLRKTLSRLESQLNDVNCRFSQCNAFIGCVERTLNSKETSSTDLLHRLKVICSNHREFHPKYCDQSSQDLHY